MLFRGSGEKEKPRKKLNKKKILKIVITIAIVIFSIVLIFLYKHNNNVRKFFDVYIFRKIVNEEEATTINIENLKSENIFAYDKYIAILDQNILKLYNKTGNIESNIDINISNPIIETNNRFLCIAEKGGQKIYLINNKNIIWQKEIEGNISSINVNKNGYVSVIISGTSYKTIVQIFDSKGNELFKNYLSATNVIDTDISDDNKFLAIAEANFSGIVAQSNIKIISIEDAQKTSLESIKYTHISETNNLIINIKYNSKNELVCMYDGHIDLLKENENVELINFKNEKILFADVNLTDKFLKIIQKGTNIINSDIEMQIINVNTQGIYTYKIESTPRKIYVEDDMIAVNLGTKVLFIDKNGWLVKNYNSKSGEIQDIVLCKNIAGIVCKNQIKIVPL